MVIEDNCPVTITAGQLSSSDDVEITIIDDGRNNEPSEDIVLLMATASVGDTGLMLGNSSLSFAIPADIPLPTVQLNYSGPTTVPSTSIQRMRIDLSETLSSAITVNFTSNGTATYDENFELNTWWLEYDVIAAGMQPPDNFSGANICPDTITSTGCTITIPAGQTIVDVRTNFDLVPGGETVNLTLGVDTDIVTLGSQSSVNFTVQAPLPTVSLNYSGSTTIATGNIATDMQIRLSRALTRSIDINLVAGGTANYALTGGWYLDYLVVPAGETAGTGEIPFGTGTICTASPCTVTIPMGVTVVRVQATIVGTANQTAITSIQIPQNSQSFVAPGTPTRHELTIQ